MTMAEEDPRHGTYAGSIAHYISKTPTCQPCKAAAAKYRRDRRARLYLARATSLEVDPTGSIRRIQALVRLGHSMRTVDDLMGWSWGTSSRFIIAGHKTTHRTTAERIAAIYESLCMVVPTGPYALRNQRIGERHGWPPPLAWDDIDNPYEQPKGARRKGDGGIDPVVVQRILAGEWRLRCNRAEREEVIRLWQECTCDDDNHGAGRSLHGLNELDLLTGWNAWRDVKRMREAS